jgi:periplasmic protein CpxP/Spy
MTEINSSVPMGEGKENTPGNNQPSVKKNKSRKKYIIGTLLVFFIIIGVIGVTIAKNKADKFREHGPMGFLSERIVKELNLNDQQKKEVEKIRDEIKTRMQEKKKSRQDTRGEMEQMFRGDTFDKQKALELAGKRDADREEMKIFFIDQAAKFHAILTPDQRNKAADKMKEMREKKGRHRKDDGQPKRDKE